MTVDDELQRRFDRAASTIDLGPGDVGEVRKRAARRDRWQSVAKVGAGLAAIAAIVAIGVSLRPADDSPTEIVVQPDDQEVADAVVSQPADAEPGTVATEAPTETSVGGSESPVTEADITYLGAFLAPAGEVQETTFAYGGEAAAFNPYGDPASDDDYGGSLFLSSHPRRNPSIGEISIPPPAAHDGTTDGLPIAELLGPFADVTGGRAMELVGSSDVGGLDEYRYGGLEVVDGPDGPRLHWTVWQYYNVSNNDVPGHGHASLDLAAPDPQGPWYLADFDNRMTAGYLFGVPDEYADEVLDGRTLLSGFRGEGATAGRSLLPPFFAYDPPAEADASARLDALRLASRDRSETELAGFGRADTAAGAAWVTTDDGRDAIVTVGYRGLGEVINGAPREQDCGINSGQHAGPYEPLVMFYNPADLTQVVAGELDASELVPYRTWNPAEHLIPTCTWELTSASFDATSGRLYVVQREADTSQGRYQPVPVIHVFQF